METDRTGVARLHNSPQEQTGTRFARWPAAQRPIRWAD